MVNGLSVLSVSLLKKVRREPTWDVLSREQEEARELKEHEEAKAAQEKKERETLENLKKRFERP